jgi:hypothetical protein
MRVQRLVGDEGTERMGDDHVRAVARDVGGDLCAGLGAALSRC